MRSIKNFDDVVLVLHRLPKDESFGSSEVKEKKQKEKKKKKSRVSERRAEHNNKKKNKSILNERRRRSPAHYTRLRYHLLYLLLFWGQLPYKIPCLQNWWVEEDEKKRWELIISPWTPYGILHNNNNRREYKKSKRKRLFKPWFIKWYNTFMSTVADKLSILLIKMYLTKEERKRKNIESKVVWSTRVNI